MAYDLTYDGKWKASVDYGDDFPLMFAIYQDGEPVDLTGQEIILGIKKGDKVMCQIVGAVSSNEVTFFISFRNDLDMNDVGVGAYKFDFWNKTFAYTYIQEGSFTVDAVAHTVDVVTGV